MRKLLFKSAHVFLVLLFCYYTKSFSQNLFLDDGITFENSKPGDGIWTEIPDYSDTTRNKYTKDNVSYKQHMVFIYDYYYIDSQGVKKKFLLASDSDEGLMSNPLQLGSYDQLTGNTIDRIMLSVTDARETFKGCDSSCTQTTIAYSYLVSKSKKNKNLSNCTPVEFRGEKFFSCGSVSTGLIDNVKNIWMHPPRQYTFKILQLSPFPFYQRDTAVKQWSWNLEVGGKYLDPRWIKHKENIQVRSDYERKGNEVLKTNFGNVMCKRVDAISTLYIGNKIVKTYLKSYYSNEYGFVKLEYININGSGLIIELIQIRKQT